MIWYYIRFGVRPGRPRLQGCLLSRSTKSCGKTNSFRYHERKAAHLQRTSRIYTYSCAFQGVFRCYWKIFISLVNSHELLGRWVTKISNCASRTVSTTKKKKIEPIHLPRSNRINAERMEWSKGHDVHMRRHHRALPVLLWCVQTDDLLVCRILHSARTLMNSSA